MPIRVRRFSSLPATWAGPIKEGIHVDQLRMFRLAPEALSVAAYFEGPRGWSVTISCRRQGETWVDGYREHYECLSTAEMADVIDRACSSALGL